MKKIKMKNKYVSLAWALVLLVGLVPLGKVMAQSEPGNEYVTIDYDNTSPTNKDVTVLIEVLDDLSGVDKLFYLNEGEEKEITLKDEDGKKQGEFIAVENGKYSFKAYDRAGNETLAKVVITNIDKIAPELTLTPSTMDKTNQDVIIKAVATDNVNVAKIVLPDNTEVEGSKADFTVTENGTYTFKAYDTAGNETVKQVEVVNINKTLPVITVDDYSREWTNQDITVTVTTDKGTLNKESHTFKENGSFTFKVIDEYGNIAEETVTIGNIDKTPPTINIKIKRDLGKKKSVDIENKNEIVDTNQDK